MQVQGRFRRFRGGLVQARCKIHCGGFGVMWWRARVPEVPEWSGAQVQGSRKVPEVSGGVNPGGSPEPCLNLTPTCTRPRRNLANLP